MEKENSVILMDLLIKEIGKMTNMMEKENLIMPMD